MAIVRWLNPNREDKDLYYMGVPRSDIDSSLWSSLDQALRDAIDSTDMYVTADPDTGITPVIPVVRDALLDTDEYFTLYDKNSRGSRLVSSYAVDSSNKRHNVKYYGVKGDNSTDDTATILTAIEEVKKLGTSTVAPFSDSGGGLYFPAGTYLIDGNIGIDNHVHLIGDYQGAVIKRKDNSSDVPMFINKDSNAVMFGLHGLRIDGNVANNATGTNKHAIDFYTDPNLYAYPAREVYDPRYIIDTCFFINHLGDAIRMRGQGASFIVSSWIHQVKGRGIYAQYDSHILGVDIGVTGLEGILIEGGSIDVVGGKIYHTGNPNFDTAGTENWTATAGIKIFNTNSCRITGVEIQDIGGAGILLDTVKSAVISGCLIDTVSAAQNGDPCIDFWNSTKNFVSFHAKDRLPSERANTPNTRYAVRFRYNSTGNTVIFNNDIPTASNPLYNPVAPGIPSDTPTANSNGGASNTVIADGTKAYTEIPYTATFKPNPYIGEVQYMVLTGATTVSKPDWVYVGMELELQFKQDATGGRVVTFPTEFKHNFTPNTGANMINTLRLRFNGTEWVQIAGVTGIAG